MCSAPIIGTRSAFAEHAFDINGVEFHGGVGFLKGGLFYADHVAVSPTYAREITTEALGAGLHGLTGLAERGRSAKSSTASMEAIRDTIRCCRSIFTTRI